MENFQIEMDFFLLSKQHRTKQFNKLPKFGELCPHHVPIGRMEKTRVMTSPPHEDLHVINRALRGSVCVRFPLRQK